MKLKPEVKQRWIEALRSDEYAQGYGALRAGENCFCCLGVLCDIASKDGVGTWGGKLSTIVLPDVEFLSGSSHEVSYLPAGVVEWAFEIPVDEVDPEDRRWERMQCLRDPNVVVAVDGDEEDPESEMGATGLSDLNDGGSTFVEIAKLIEEQL